MAFAPFPPPKSRRSTLLHAWSRLARKTSPWSLIEPENADHPRWSQTVPNEKAATVFAPLPSSSTDERASLAVEEGNTDPLSASHDAHGDGLHAACHHEDWTTINRLLDRGEPAGVRTAHGWSAVDLLVLNALARDEANRPLLALLGASDRPPPGPQDLDAGEQARSNTAASGPIGSNVLQDPQDLHLKTIERLLAAGARFHPSVVPLVASQPLGFKLESRALRAMVLVPSPTVRKPQR